MAAAASAPVAPSASSSGDPSGSVTVVPAIGAMLLTAVEDPPEDDAVGAPDPLQPRERRFLLAVDDEDPGDAGRRVGAGARLEDSDLGPAAPRSSQP